MRSRVFLAGVLLPSLVLAAKSPQTPIAGSSIPQFVQPLPLLSVHSQAAAPNVIDTVFGSTPTALTLTMCEFDSKVLPLGTLAPNQQPLTRTWGYIAGTTCPTGPQETYLGPVIVNTRGIPTEINFVNSLGDTSGTGVLAYKYSTDLTLHWADPGGIQQDQTMPPNPTLANFCAMTGGIPLPGSKCAQNYAGSIAAVPHLHGGEVPPELDGGPDAWFTSDGTKRGHAYYSKASYTSRDLLGNLIQVPAAANASVYRYPNTQQAAPIWFHDHTLGATRLNVFAGLAGGYYIVDPNQALPAGFPSAGDTIPIILQDRMFDTQGQLFFPADSAANLLWTTNPEHPYWVPEFVGDAIVVNGKAWPFFAAQPRLYRFLFLNGSNARTYELFLVNQANKGMGPSMYVISNDDGYLDAPVRLDPAAGQKLLIMPGERYEVVIDFTGLAGTNFLLKNTAKTPYPGGASPTKGLDKILQIRVGACPAGGCNGPTWNPAAAGATIRANGDKIVRLTNPATGTAAAGVTWSVRRQLTLNEVLAPPRTATDPVTGLTAAYPGGPLEILVNNTKWSGASTRTYKDFRAVTINGITTAYSETPLEGTTELWEIVNLTADAHPIHTHLASFQLMNRQGYNTNKYAAAYATAFPGSPGCLAATYCPGFGPPLSYKVPNASGAVGGNPDVNLSLQGPVLLPTPQEVGWKDTIMVPPGMVTRFIVRWAPNDAPIGPAAGLAYPFDPDGVDPKTGQVSHGYVWHCHIIDHEDNEMMRPDQIDPNTAAVRSYVRGIDY